MKHNAQDGGFLVRVLHVGEMASCCYLAGRENAEGIIIDPGGEAERIAESVELMKLDIRRIILTHGHADHIGAFEKLREIFPQATTCIHEDDAPMLERPSLNLSLFLGRSITCRPPDELLHDGDTLTAAGVEVKVLHVPGHTPGSVCLYAESAGIVFTGDVLFQGGIGRTDFPGGNMNQLLTGVREKLLTLPPDTIVYPGHGGNTTIAAEKSGNPFL